MSTSKTMPVKHIFLDIVGYTHNRSVEAQQDIIESLYKIVKDAVAEFQIESDNVIYLPTGDGVCISLIDVEARYDLNIKLAISLLQKVSEQNKTTTNIQRQYQVRVGLSANIDNIVTDINGNLNITGAGINTAQRVMNVGDGGNIFVSDNVYETLRYREEYMQSFKGFNVYVKHGLPLKVYQFINSKFIFLNLKISSTLQVKKKEDRVLTSLTAFYFANSIHYKDMIIEINNRHPFHRDGLIILLYFLALDCKSQFHKKEHEKPTYNLKYNKSFLEWFEIIQNSNLWVRRELAAFIISSLIETFWELVENDLFINEKGIEKLKADHPDVWQFMNKENE